MTSEEAWVVSKRVLGTFFLIQGFLYLAEALRMVGIVLPEGSSRAGYTSASLLQGVVAIAAGAILLRGRVQLSISSPPVVDRRILIGMALQILGVFFLVRGTVSLANPALSVFLVHADWSFRASEFVSAGVELLAGIVLVSWPIKLAAALAKYEGA